MNWTKAKSRARAVHDNKQFLSDNAIRQKARNVVQCNNETLHKDDTNMVYHKRGYVEVDLPNAAHRGHMMHVKANEEIVACKYGVCTRVFRCKETCRLHEKFGRVANTIEEPANEVSGHTFNTLTT